MHGLGVLCGIAAGAWLGAAEAPTKLVTAGLSPYTISLCMVAGVFVARWTFPTLLRGTSYVFEDLIAKPHLIAWAILAGGAVGRRKYADRLCDPRRRALDRFSSMERK